MVSPAAIEAIRSELRRARIDRGSQGLVGALRRIRPTRSALRPLLTGERLAAARDGHPFAGLARVLRENGITSDSSRVLGRLDVKAAAVRRWADVLLDCRRSPSERLAVVQDHRRIPHLGRNVFSLVLHLRQPARFGVLNGPVQTALTNLGEWPTRFPAGLGPGDRYLQINGLLCELAGAAGLDHYGDDRLAILDHMLWRFQESDRRVERTAQRRGTLNPGDPDSESELSALEGGRNLVGPHLRLERSCKLARGVKQSWMGQQEHLPCAVCGFSFLFAYGDLGRGFIEAHHRESLAARKRTSRSGRDDFEPVCSNCHRMLHRMGPGRMDVEELRRILQQAAAARRRHTVRRRGEPRPCDGTLTEQEVRRG